ncbi:PREDICTED: chymotrypsin inhibitor-like [Dinoponera quadriceps]|uniref:Chymotrypsin inhibitor-like n=1 Tax=Dinoponera quadriceps TaxID=609295 RepID=A0A6P3XB56_DINQU|nr:PREDICTED: chymotrypsin inhibitor-like [Dinoponera quadriceps]
MPRASFVLLIAIAVFFGTATSNQVCGPNAEYTTCGSACQPTCSNPDPHQICTLQCVIGCQCKEGFLSNGAGQCVSPQNC